MNPFGLPSNPFQAQPQDPVQNFHKAFMEYEKKIKERDPNGCLLFYSSKIAGGQPLDSVVFLTLTSKMMGQLRRSGCKNLWFHITAFGGDIRTVDMMKKVVEDLGFEEVNVIAPLRLGSTASLTSFVIYDKLYVNTNTIIDPFNITIQIGMPNAFELNTFLEVMDFLMKSPGKGKEMEDAIRTQAYSLMLSSGALFGYVEATKEQKFIRDILESYIQGKLLVHEEEFEEVFLGAGDRISTGLTGRRLKEYLRNVIVMDEEDPELSQLSLEKEEVAQQMFEQSGLGGVLAISGQISTFGVVQAPVLPALPLR
ncbi:hypothetical protein IPA_06595 [Ignicoccus pacificus DSM 13166]|uniref:Uncharacterized protein n=1 Tax=Ignicoccus pacificus DSM 13166 TaxID=940294 RepID=A0A977KBF5_9CREN|nr:hypothetical protein IPA_06595 [Ignicoccus pacificus DSM 13166]